MPGLVYRHWGILGWFLSYRLLVCHSSIFSYVILSLLVCSCGVCDELLEREGMRLFIYSQDSQVRQVVRHREGYSITYLSTDRVGDSLQLLRKMANCEVV